jgi:hypothetical protein
MLGAATTSSSGRLIGGLYSVDHLHRLPMGGFGHGVEPANDERWAAVGLDDLDLCTTMGNLFILGLLIGIGACAFWPFAMPPLGRHGAPGRVRGSAGRAAPLTPHPPSDESL